MKLNFFYQLMALVSAAIMSGGLSIGCSKDQNADDFKKQLAQNQKAQQSSAAGTYSGVLNDNAGNPLGAIQISLVSKMLPQKNTDGTAGTAAATLVGYIDYLNEGSKVSFVTDTIVSTPNYDPTTGNYTAQILIQTANSRTQTLNLSATILNGAMNGGTIQSASSSTNVLNFTLAKNGGVLSDIAAKVHTKASSADPSMNQVMSFIGTTTFKLNNQTKPVHILILKPRKGTAEDFLDLVVPGNSVTVSLNYGGAVQLVNSGANLDFDSNSLTGLSQIPETTLGQSGTPTTVNVPLNLACTFANQNKSIHCTHIATTGAGLVAESNATLDANNSQDPADDASARAAVRKTFPAYLTQDVKDAKTGKIIHQKVSQKYPNGQDSSAINLQVMFPARSTNDELVDLFISPSEQNVTVTIVDFADLPGRGVNIGIRNVAWNEVSKTLNGTDQITVSGTGQAILMIDCTNFKSTQTVDSKEAFNCIYSTNQSEGGFQFTGAAK